MSKISYGFASGGSDLPTKSNAELFGGGAGAGINITPVAFITIKDGSINILPITDKPAAADRVVSMVPEMVDKLFNKKKKDDSSTEA